jgi:hypothetical protein
MTFLKQNWYRVGIVLLMLVALGQHPYGYYQFLRWATAISSFYLAYLAYSDKKNGWAWTFGAVGVLFNPISPFYLDREKWQLFNLAIAVIYSISIFKFKLNHEQHN